MNCAEFETLLDSGKLRPGRLPVEAAGHLQSCPPCRTALENAEFAGKVFKAASCRLDDDLRVSIMDAVMRLPIPAGGNVYKMPTASGPGTRAAGQSFLRTGKGLAFAAMAACVAALVLYPGLLGLFKEGASSAPWTIAAVSGEVMVQSPSAVSKVIGTTGPVASGSVISCESGGSLTMVLPGRAVLTLEGPFSISPGSGKAILDSGTVECEVTPGTGGFSVLSGQWEVKVLGTSFEVSSSPDSRSLMVSVTRGRVAVVGPRESLLLDKGEWVSVGPRGVCRGRIGKDTENPTGGVSGVPSFDGGARLGAAGEAQGSRSSFEMGLQKAGAAPGIPDSVQLIAPGMKSNGASDTAEVRSGSLETSIGGKPVDPAKGSTSSGPGNLIETKSGL